MMVGHVTLPWLCQLLMMVFVLSLISQVSSKGRQKLRVGRSVINDTEENVVDQTGNTTDQPRSITDEEEYVGKNISISTRSKPNVTNTSQPNVTIGCGSTYSSESGLIQHPLASGNYSNNENCIWIITSATPLRISFSIFSTELNYDHLHIRKGNNSGSPLLGTFSGWTLPETLMTMGDAYIQFTSDGNNTATGFVLHWNISECPVGFVNISGRCYLFGEHLGHNARTQAQARLFCQSLSCDNYNVDLATLGHGGASEAEPVLKYIKDNGLAAYPGLWLGALKSGWRNYTWVDGRDLSRDSYLWMFSEPEANDCVFVSSYSSYNDYNRIYIEDTECTESHKLVCEKFKNQ